MQNIDKDTGSLANELIQANNVNDFVHNNNELLVPKNISEYLSNMMKKYNKSKKEVIQQADMVPVYAYQIFDGKRTSPGRDKLLQLAFGFPLTIEEANELLRAGGFNSLYVRNKKDAYIMFSLAKKHTIAEVNELLINNNEPPLL